MVIMARQLRIVVKHIFDVSIVIGSWFFIDHNIKISALWAGFLLLG
jgi:hypothetical protein